MPVTELTLTLPIPPSVNALHIGAAKGRRRSPAYIGWLNEAGWRIAEARGKHGPRNLPAERWYWTDIRLPHTHVGDTDNRLKALHDLLHEMGVTPDDKWLLGGTYMRCPQVEPGHVEVHARSLAGSRLTSIEQLRIMAEAVLAETEPDPWQSIGGLARTMVEGSIR